jgi:hypothetical protein
VRAASLVARPPVSMSGPATTTFESELDVSKKLELTIESHRRSLTFDFRTEPIEIIQEALALIERGMPLLETPRVDSDVQQTPPGHRANRRTDELLKLANLKSAGFLTDDEFERETARILGS